MLKLFRNTKILYYTISSIGALLILFLANPFDGMYKNIFSPIINTFSAGPFVLMWIIIVAIICNRFAVEKMNKIIKIMIDDCNIQEYINIYNKLLTRRISIKTKTYLLLNLSAGYLSIGNSELAKQVLDRVNNFPNNRYGAESKVCYYNNLCAYYLQINNNFNAIAMLEKMKLALDSSKLQRSKRDMFYSLYNNKQFLINIKNGNYDGSEQVFSIAFNREQHTLGKVAAKFTLGIIYMYYNKLTEAIDAFEYVADNGGDSHYVDKSKHFLNQIKLH